MSEARCPKAARLRLPGRPEEQCPGELGGGMGIPEKLGSKGLYLGGSEKGGGRSGRTSLLRE